MAELVNLNRLRKQRTRAEARAQAAANRIKHGRTGAEKAKDRLETARRERQLDGAKQEPEPA